MQTMQFREKVGEDGVLRLEVRDLPIGQEVEAVLVVQTRTNNQGHIQERHDWVDILYGSCADEPIERLDQGEWPQRE